MVYGVVSSYVVDYVGAMPIFTMPGWVYFDITVTGVLAFPSSNFRRRVGCRVWDMGLGFRLGLWGVVGVGV